MFSNGVLKVFAVSAANPPPPPTPWSQLHLYMAMMMTADQLKWHRIGIFTVSGSENQIFLGSCSLLIRKGWAQLYTSPPRPTLILSARGMGTIPRGEGWNQPRSHALSSHGQEPGNEVGVEWVQVAILFSSIERQQRDEEVRCQRFAGVESLLQKDGNWSSQL